MEQQQKKKKKLYSHSHISTSKTKRKRQPHFDFDVNTTFSLLLAAVSTPHNPYSVFLLPKCLTHLHSALLPQSPHPLQTLPSPILSLLPLLILSERQGIASCAAEIVGAASLLSLRTNEVIALDDGVVRALISVLGCSKRRVALAACNAVLDLSTTSFGRQRLVEFSAIQRLISTRFSFLQVSASTGMSVSIGTVYVENSAILKAGYEGDELLISILNAAIVLINTCHFKHLEKIPSYHLKAFMGFLKNLWIEVRIKMIQINEIECSQEQFDMSNISTNDLAASIFRLSMSTDQISRVFPVEKVKILLGLSGSNFEEFMASHWEASPCLMQKSSRINEEADFIGSFVGSITSIEKIHSFISPMLGRLVSCSPIASDELDIHNFLEEARTELGFPLIYQQDIRVLRTDQCLKREIHFFQKNFEPCCIKGPHFLKLHDALKCEEAFKEGYTIALRGMEFRHEKIAAISNTLASLFGQPSVGANMYLTPPGSQGLTRHYDDHCVFVCQLAGSKQWTVFSPPRIRLPRLYDFHEFPSCSEVESALAVGRQFFLREGDVLYIPRGFLHEARTVSGGPDGSSLHLTFGIEVEPPFDDNSISFSSALGSSQGAGAEIGVLLSFLRHMPSLKFVVTAALLVPGGKDLFILQSILGIGVITQSNACLVAACSLPSETNDRLGLIQKTTFSRLLDKISSESKFSEVLAALKISVEKDEDPFHRMRWLRLLNVDGKESIKDDKWTMPSIGIRDLLSTCVNHREQIGTTFVEVKSRFCREVRFKNAVECYQKLLKRFRKVHVHRITYILASCKLKALNHDLSAMVLWVRSLLLLGVDFGGKVTPCI
ncbi:Lysine-specific demethylase NO66 [Cucumis melo var. makuwa]|uniref:Bifunctional lysine-specific demethylase and histidyl-hydroxylase n=1 Tax=Cucumis melo var. makuwa TaxID=1194695 RepID=A0A5A7UQP6_CUCMM|nr:Lysine-specific demethylase NO66 [Cucumis melo var. makuwa]